MEQTFEIIKLLPEIIKKGNNGESVLLLKNMGLSDNKIDEVFEIISQGFGRAMLYKAGMQPNQCSSYLDGNPIFLETINLIMNNKVNLEDSNEAIHPKLKNTYSQNNVVDFDKLLLEFNDLESEDRADALFELIENNYSNIITLIEKSLFDSDELVQIVAIQGINEVVFNQNIFSKLIELFNQTENHTLISNITQIFNKFNCTKAVSSIIKKLHSENLMIVYDCISCLGEIGKTGDESIINALLPFKNIKKKPKIYDEFGFLEETTDFTIGQITVKVLKKINK